MHLVGRPFAERHVLALPGQLQEAMPWQQVTVIPETVPQHRLHEPRAMANA
jgi:hypothetical protein